MNGPFFLRSVQRAFWCHSKIKPTNVVYFLSMSINGSIAAETCVGLTDIFKKWSAFVGLIGLIDGPLLFSEQNQNDRT
jgi:hypothetical protein